LIDATGCRSGAAIAIDRENAYLRHADPKPDARGPYQMSTLSRPGRLLLFAGSAVALFLITVAAAPVAKATDWKKAKEVSVVTTESKFTPNKLTFRRGIPYKLHVQNRGKEMHEFNAAELFKTVKINNPNVLNADKTELVLRPGETKDLYFIPRQAGHFKLVCPDHDWAGMTGEITVE
jgi:uncharacterized cupredoxin-like copper-binding protein